MNLEEILKLAHKFEKTSENISAENLDKLNVDLAIIYSIALKLEQNGLTSNKLNELMIEAKSFDPRKLEDLTKASQISNLISGITKYIKKV